LGQEENLHIPIAEILEYLDTNDESQKSMVRSLADCKTAQRADQLMEEIQCKEVEYNLTVRTKGNKPFCSLFYATIYYLRGDYEQATIQFERAEMGFRGSGQERNWAIALWLHALALQRTDRAEPAKKNFDKAIKILENISTNFQRTGRYDEMVDCANIIKKIKQSTSASPGLSVPEDQSIRPPFAEGRESKSAQPVSSTPIFSQKAVYPPRPVIFPIYDPVSAGKGGDFIFDSEPQGQASILELVIDEKPFRVYSMREKEPAILQPRIYRWLYVVGDSMNLANPYPLLKGDCILVVETESSGLSPKSNDIVVAALLDPAGSADRAGVVKKYTNEGLCSVSTMDYPVIPLKKARVKGIVVAVAKPVATQ
jgi:tetratricopeptide (TPR) repeat protein